MKSLVVFEKEEFDNIRGNALSIKHRLDDILKKMKEEGDLKDSLYVLRSDVESLFNKLDD